MITKNVRKTADKIKEEILSSLGGGPISIEDIRKDVGSNWSTINTYLRELADDGKVKEIISTNKARLYQRVFGDTYFDIPITEEQRKRFHTLFSMILEGYKKKGKMPTKTHIAKCAVHVIDNKEARLEDLPIVWYLYGMMPLMAIDISAQYQKEEEFKNEKKIQDLIFKFINENGDKKSGQIQKEQHRKYNEEMYVAVDNLFEVLNRPHFENKNIIEWLDALFIACPTNGDFLKVFDLVEEVISIIQKLDLMKVSLKTHRKQIFQLLDSLWKVIAIYKLSKSVLQRKNALNKEILFDFYLNGAIEDRKRSLQESFLEINSIYLNELANFDPESIKLSDEAKEIARIMEDWTGED